MWPVRGVLVLVVVTTTGSGGLAACGEPQAVAAARAAIETACPCAAALSRSAYLRCARGVTRGRVDRGELPADCRGAIRQCVSRSTCGRPRRVTCCMPRPSGVTCRVRADAASCIADGGTLGGCPSCCDACGGSCTTTTTSTSSTTTTIPFCGGPGDAQCTGNCGPTGTCMDAGGYCVCTYNNCGGGAFPECNGTCPPDSACVDVGTSCECGINNCSGGAYPECNGSCPSGSTCFNQGLSCECVSDTCNASICGCVQEWPYLCGSSDDCLPGRSCVFCPHAGIRFCSSGACAAVADCLPGDYCQDLRACEFP